MSPDGAQAFILSNNKILLGKRSTKGLYHGLWATFGGKIEQGETPSECLFRELYEELGIHIENTEWIDVIEDDFKHDIHFFSVKSWKGEITNKGEHYEIRWFGLDEIEDLQMVDIVREVINRRFKYLLLGTERNCNLKLDFPEVTTHAIMFDETRKKILLILWQNPLGQEVWSFPGGHIKSGERVKEALMREVKEETGYEIEVGKLLGVYDNIVRDISTNNVIAHIINIIWFANILFGTLDFSKDEEIIDAKWFPYDRAKKLRMSSTAKKILQDALANI